MRTDARLQKASPNNPNPIFSYGTETVNQYSVGIQELYYSFGDQGYPLETISCSMNPDHTAHQVAPHVTMDMKDSHGHTLDASSYVDVACVAMLDGDDHLQLSPNIRFASQSTSSPIPNGGFTERHETALQGFTMSYGQTEKPVHQLRATISVAQPPGDTITLGGYCRMQDFDKFIFSSTNLLEGLYMATFDPGAHQRLAFKVVDCQFSDNGHPQTVKFSRQLGGKPLTGACAFIQSYQIGFRNVQILKSLRLGASDITVGEDGTSVTFIPHLQKEDNDGNDTAWGDLKVLIVGIIDL